MAKRRTRNPLLKAFGQRLVELRAGRSRQWISLQLERLGAKLDASSYYQYEAGTVWAPDIGVLTGLALIYGVPRDDLIQLVLENRKNTTATDWRDLLRHHAIGGSAPGGADHVVAASSSPSRLRELEEERDRFAAALRETTDVAKRLIDIAAVVKKGRTTGDEATSRRRRHRRTG